MNEIHRLSQNSSRLLSSGNIITSVFSVVKELVENSLDGGATNVEVKLNKGGLEKIEIRDNGRGIKQSDMPVVAKSHFTSKITSFDDLEALGTYGFRGEALGAVCAVSNLKITTQTADDDMSMIYVFDKQGNIVSKKPSPSPQGTTVSVENLFHNLPVRLKFYKSEKHRHDEIKKIEDLLQAFSCAQIGTRFALFHNQSLIWSKSRCSDLKAAVIQVFGASNFQLLKHRKEEYEEECSIEAYLPKKDASPIHIFRSSCDRTLIILNRRPVKIKAIEKLLQDAYSCDIDNVRNRYPIGVLLISVPLSKVDVNVDPNKSQVLLHNFDTVLSRLSNFFKHDSDHCEAPPSENGITITSVHPPENDKSNLEHSHAVQANVNKVLQPKATNPSVSQSLHFSSANVTPLKVLNEQLKQGESDLPLPRLLFVEQQNKQPQITGSMRANSVEGSSVHHIATTLERHFSVQDKGRKESENQITSQNSLELDTVVSHSLVNNDVLRKSGINEPGLGKNLTCAKELSPTETLNSKEISVINRVDELLINSSHVMPTKMVSSDANWAQGKLNLLGEDFQPVAVFAPPVPKKRQVNQESSSPVKKLKMLIETLVPNARISDIAPKTGFDAFCCAKRLEASAQNPNISKKELAQRLLTEWNTLAPEKREIYSKSIEEQRKRYKTPAKAVNANAKPRVHCDAMLVKHPCEKLLEFSFEKLKHYFSRNYSNKKLPGNLNETCLNPIKRLSQDTWVCNKGSKLVLLNTFRLREMVFYSHLMETHLLKPDLSISPVSITPEDLGESECYEILLLACKQEKNTVFSNPCFTHNGFGIKFSLGNYTADLVSVTSKIHDYGLQDLKEMLCIMKSKGMSVALSECRPSKVKVYLQAEATRIARKTLAVQKASELADVLNQSQKCLKDIFSCFHDQPICHELLNISSIE